MILSAGIDVGGTKCLGVVIDENGKLLRQARQPTPYGGDALIATLASVAAELGEYDTLGIGIPGLVTREGILRAAPNIGGIADTPVGPRLRERLGHQVSVDNDATCAAVAEWTLGAAKGTSDMIMVTLGTGIGGGVVAGSRLQRGFNGFAGEIGHMIVDPDGPECPCGRRGCWERFASGSGLAFLARRAFEDGRLAGVVEPGADASSIRGEHVAAAAREGNSSAIAVLDEFARWVAIGLVNLTNLLDPAMFVLGGGLAELGQLLHGPTHRWFRELLYAPSLRPHPQLVIAELGERAGAYGAAMLPRAHA
jgi:glucokinase